MTVNVYNYNIAYSISFISLTQIKINHTGEEIFGSTSIT